MKNSFEEIMSKKTDVEILKIVSGPESDYQPLALEAARKELSRRNLPYEEIVQTQTYFKEEMQLKEQKAYTPLETVYKVLFFLFPFFGLLNMFTIGSYKIGGYKKKADDVVRWTIFGFCFWVILSILFSV